MASLSATSKSAARHGAAVARLVFAYVFLALASEVGCGRSGPGMERVTGVVLYNGRPVAGSRVTFHGPLSPRAAVGTTNAAGEFTLTTMTSGDGAVVGEHRVSITTFTPEAIAKLSNAQQEALGRGEKVSGSGLPARYSSFDKSGLSVVVERGAKNHFQFELTD